MANEITPAIWIGCQSCYAEHGALGRWYTLDALEDARGDSEHVMTPALLELIKGSHPAWVDTSECEEFVVMDHEYLPIKGELGLDEAYEWMLTVNDVLESDDFDGDADAEQRYTALTLHASNHAHDLRPGWELVRDLTEQFRGIFATEQELAWNEADSQFCEVPSQHPLWSYFDIESYIRDLRHRMWWEHVNGEVYAFSHE